MHKYLAASLAAAAAITGVAAVAQVPAQGAPRPAMERPDVTRAEAQDRAGKMFDRIDLNKDGQLDEADRAARQRARFDRLDGDGNGTISFEEFNAQREGRQQRAQQQDARRGAARRSHMARPRPMAMGRGADLDGDGKISREEFTSRALARFDRSDADKNGTVTAQERQETRRTLRGMRRGPEAG